ncbi:MAG: serine protease [Spirochaetaceae bacterium]|nr:serine protease [Spirochaetaceae bacterium]
MIKKLVIPLSILLIFSCKTGPEFNTMSADEIEQSLIEISIKNIGNLIDDGNPLKAVQLTLSVDENEADYDEINSLLPRALSEMKRIFSEAVNDREYEKAIKYYKSYQALDMPEEVQSHSLKELQFNYVNQLFEDNYDAAAISYLYDNILYEDLSEENLLLLEQRLINAENQSALQDLFDYYVSNGINALPDTVKLLNETSSIEKMIRGTVTVWINRGIKIEKGIGYPDRGIGSGFFIDNNGHILTNYHVISSEVDPEYEGFSRLFIKLSDDSEERIPAKVIGWDKELDVALLKAEVDPEYLFSMSRKYEPALGDKIYAIGSPGGLKNTMTSGSVSSLNRQLQPLGDSLQIDVPINPGNSGGPLLNSSGEVLGIIFAGIEQFEGVNFAIPISDVKNVLPNLYAGGRVTHPWLGCGLFERNNHLEVMYVLPGSPAAQVGLMKGDIISAINGDEFHKISAIQRYILKNDAGTIIKINWMRDSGNFSAVASLDERPDFPMETALSKDIIDNLFIPFFGMAVERIRGRGDKNVLYRINDVYPGLTADESGLSVGDTVLLRKWTVLEDVQVLIMQILMKSRKAGFIESAVQIGTYIQKGFFI